MEITDETLPAKYICYVCLNPPGGYYQFAVCLFIFVYIAEVISSTVSLLEGDFMTSRPHYNAQNLNVDVSATGY